MPEIPRRGLEIGIHLVEPQPDHRHREWCTQHRMRDDDRDHHARGIEHGEPAQHREREDDERDGGRQERENKKGLFAKKS